MAMDAVGCPGSVAERYPRTAVYTLTSRASRWEARCALSDSRASLFIPHYPLSLYPLSTTCHLVLEYRTLPIPSPLSQFSS